MSRAATFHAGPKSTSSIVGWDAQKAYRPEFNRTFARRSVELVGSHIHVVGDRAWENGTEVGQAHMKVGTIRKVDWFARFLITCSPSRNEYPQVCPRRQRWGGTISVRSCCCRSLAALVSGRALHALLDDRQCGRGPNRLWAEQADRKDRALRAGRSAQ